MTNEDAYRLVLEIIAEIAPDEDLSDVKPEINLRDQIDLDSMDFLDIVMELRKKYGIVVPVEDYALLASLSSSAKHLIPKFKSVSA